MSARFLIEVPHEATTLACARAVEILLKSGSHFLTRADWGCRDGVHSAWIIVDVDSKDEARAILPPALRPQARVVQLNSFSISEIDHLLRTHDA